MPLVGGFSAGFAGANNIIIFIDGGYLRRNFKNLFSHEDINYANLANFLIKHASTDHRFASHLIRVYFYDGIANVKDIDIMKDESVEEILVKQIATTMIDEKEQKQEEYVQKIRSLDLFDVRLGRLMLSTKGGSKNKENWSFRQKGVDSLVVLDMITKGFEGQYNTAILLAGDLDFIEIVNAVKHLGPNVVGAFFDKHINQKLEDSFDKKIVLKKDTFVSNNLIG
ncbi:MAG: NYN domain-containing protein [Thaumarchaeota archaeon]|nr:NYN domain-containing protein [Nitrososphaerota archaeon]